MINLRQRILELCDIVGVSGADIAIADSLPQHTEVLKVANGFATRGGFFRFFGTDSLHGLPSLRDMNQATWKEEYGDVFDGFYILAEDIFGDQYGFAADESGRPHLCKIFCEGGEKESCGYDSLYEFLVEAVLVPEPSAFDFSLATDASEAGLRPQLDEHLAFQLPLICGGEYSLANMGAEKANLHLSMLAQMTRQNALLDDGTDISGFRG